MTDRCWKTDLPTGECAHCRGDDLPGLPRDWTTTNPTPLPRAVPAPEVPKPRGFGWYAVPVLREIADAYPRLFEELPAGSKKPNPAENSVGFGSAPDPRKAPVRVEVHDLIAEIEREVPDLARWACQTMSLTACISAPVGSDFGRPDEYDPRVESALDTLDHYWGILGQHAPEMGDAIEDRLVRLLSKARRLLGESSAPVPLATPCPECREITVFRLETERGSLAVCGNPVCRDEWGEKNQWTEVEWEDAHDPRRYVSESSTAGVRRGQEG
jgi:hypothetical protein